MLAQQDPTSWPAALAITIAISVALGGTGLLLIAIATRAADGRLGRNVLAGIRTRATRASDEAWLAAHRAGERPTRLGGLLAIALGPLAVVVGLVASALAGSGTDGYLRWWTIAVVVGTILVLAAVVHGAVLGQRAARATGP